MAFNLECARRVVELLAELLADPAQLATQVLAFRVVANLGERQLGRQWATLGRLIGRWWRVAGDQAFQLGLALAALRGGKRSECQSMLRSGGPCQGIRSMKRVRR